MPLLDSFKVNHKIMPAPAVRVAKIMKTPKGDDITVFDLRFCKPNKDILSERGIHTLEHLFAGFIRKYLNKDGIEVIDVSPMGCRTGFYMSVIGTPTAQEVASAWTYSMQDVLLVESERDIPELNEYQCGTFEMHSLEEAKNIANNILKSKVDLMKNEDLLLSDKYL